MLETKNTMMEIIESLKEWKEESKLISEVVDIILDEIEDYEDPQDYFEYVKSMKEKMTNEFLDNLYKIIMKQIGKAFHLVIIILTTEKELIYTESIKQILMEVIFINVQATPNVFEKGTVTLTY